MKDKRITIDTNILIYSVDTSAGSKHEQAKNIIDKAMLIDCILTTQALSEFYSVATRKGHATHEQASSFIKVWTEIFPIVGSNGNVFDACTKRCERI